jgi:hypothetical protein
MTESGGGGVEGFLERHGVGADTLAALHARLLGSAAADTEPDPASDSVTEGEAEAESAA